MYPENDEQYEETTIKSVKGEKEGWSIGRADGWSFFVPAQLHVTPQVGDDVRFYGKGIGYTVRGLFIDGIKVFYRTEEEDKEHHLITTYGKDAQEWLSRWDEGRSVWSVAMGGFGPGYEQALQIAAVEIVRFMLEKGYDAQTWEDAEKWGYSRKAIEHAMTDRLEKLGLSGAQFHAALGLAVRIYRDGPIAVMKNVDNSRAIQVSKHFPSL